MIPISEALAIIKREIFRLEAETVELSESAGRVLAEEICADMDLPPFDRSQMDGFAVCAKDTKNAPVKFIIIGEAVAGKGFEGEVKKGEAVRITTGAPLAKGADAVQKVELTRETGGFIEILEATKEKQNVIRRAEEIEKGAKVFSPGELITANMIASLASFGYAKVKVGAKPKVSILATGSEIVDVNETPKQDQIRNSNSIMLDVFARRAGAETEVLPLVRDDFETLKNQIAEAVGLKSKVQSSKFKVQSQKSEIRSQKSEVRSQKSEVLLITGGVSVGDYDFTKPALRELGAEIFFEKVSLKPGKPTVFARLNDKLIFGLPGNPVSVAVTFYLFVRTALLRMQGALDGELKKGFAVASEKIKGAKERDSFLPVSLKTGADGKLEIEALRFRGSSNFIAFARADALVFVPRGATYEAGAIARILYLP